MLIKQSPIFFILINSLLHMLCWGNSIVVCAELWRVSMETKYLKSGAISAFVPYTGNTCYWYQSKFKFSSFNCSQFIPGILADSAVYNLCMVHCVLIKFWIENRDSVFLHSCQGCWDVLVDDDTWCLSWRLIFAIVTLPFSEAFLLSLWTIWFLSVALRNFDGSGVKALKMN